MAAPDSWRQAAAGARQSSLTCFPAPARAWHVQRSCRASGQRHRATSLPWASSCTSCSRQSIVNYFNCPPMRPTGHDMECTLCIGPLSPAAPSPLCCMPLLPQLGAAVAQLQPLAGKGLRVGVEVGRAKSKDAWEPLSQVEPMSTHSQLPAPMPADRVGGHPGRPPGHPSPQRAPWGRPAGARAARPLRGPAAALLGAEPLRPAGLPGLHRGAEVRRPGEGALAGRGGCLQGGGLLPSAPRRFLIS